VSALFCTAQHEACVVGLDPGEAVLFWLPDPAKYILRKINSVNQTKANISKLGNVSKATFGYIYSNS